MYINGVHVILIDSTKDYNLIIYNILHIYIYIYIYIYICAHESAVLCDGCGTVCGLSAPSMVSGETGELICNIILLV